jgi:hypothetical protein
MLILMEIVDGISEKSNIIRRANLYGYLYAFFKKLRRATSPNFVGLGVVAGGYCTGMHPYNHFPFGCIITS